MTIAPKPPLGLTPKRNHDLNRANDILGAISRYINNSPSKQVPAEWISELDDLLDKSSSIFKQPLMSADK